MLTDKKKAYIQERLTSTAPYITPGEWYHEDVPMLLREIEWEAKQCPNGGNDGYVSPRPCQCEVEGLQAEISTLKSRLEEVERERDKAVSALTKSCSTCIYSDEWAAGGCKNCDEYSDWQLRGSLEDTTCG